MESQSRANSRVWIYDLLLVLVLLVGAFFRSSGLQWDEFTWMHPDERFLIWVTADIHPVDSIGAYFNTAESTLNPNNVGHGFYVYGTFPIFLTRYLTQSIFEATGWQEIALTGRALSAVFDLLAVLLVYLTAARAYNRRTAIFAAAFLAAAVLPIQLSNFYKEDTFLNFFTLLAIYFAVRISTRGWLKNAADEPPSAEKDARLHFDLRAEWPVFVGFGVALGLAVASKINAAPVALTLPLAVLVRAIDLTPSERNRNAVKMIGLLALAAVSSLLVFRIAQPYAFSGPGFFNVGLNSQWVDNLREQRNQAAGDIDFPPSLQWARRPIWFGLQNIVLWGLGLPLGMLAVIGFIWVGWRMLHGSWRRHLVLWIWTAAYFTWQSLQFNPTMRYFLPIYPMLAIYAGWTLDQLLGRWQARRSVARAGRNDRWNQWIRIGAVVLAGIVLAATYTYAYAFSRIHTRPFSRAEASRWIFEHIPGPINFSIAGDGQTENQIVPVPYEFVLRPDTPFLTNFIPRIPGIVQSVTLHQVVDQNLDASDFDVFMRVQQEADNLEPQVLGSGTAVPLEGSGEMVLDLNLDRDQTLFSDQSYYLILEPAPGQPAVEFNGTLTMTFDANGEQVTQIINQGPLALENTLPLEIPFAPATSGILTGISLQGSLSNTKAPASGEISISFSNTPDGSNPLASGSAASDFSNAASLEIMLDRPLSLSVEQPVYMTVALDAPEGSGVFLRGAAVANEGDWDDGLPLRMDGYDPFGGIYQRDLNLNMYWDDNPDKLARFERILGQAEYVFISSSRQWATLPRLPERFPMTTVYYRNLLGCPPEQSIEWCYNVAEPGMFTGNLGFELVDVVQSAPQIGSLTINDQFAEEAFTVYDHPKVFIFKKTPAYDPDQVTGILGNVDFSHVIRVTPKRAASHPMDLMLPTAQLIIQRMGGTWATLFQQASLINRSVPLAVVVWYAFIFLLGAAVYPLVRWALPGLADRGYAVSRITGMLLFAYLAWLAGSMQVSVTRGLLLVVFMLLAAAGLAAAYRQRGELLQELRARRNYLIIIEGIALAAFLVFLLVRLGNSDLWHPWKGGEKPMDFAYFNAVLKSTTFPPYDPWYAGGYINYYYYGFVLVGMPVKLLGITPSVAYNLILPTIFMLFLLGSFSVGYNLLNPPGNRYEYTSGGQPFWKSLWQDLSGDRGFLIGSLSGLFVGILGNLGTLRMIFRGYQTIAAPSSIENANILSRIYWALSGFLKVLSGAELPYGIADWYWLPSRAIAAQGDVEPITEFPYFTVLYADLHAHLIALPVTLLVLTWGLSVIQSRASWGNIYKSIWGLGLGGLAIGALRPTNTWDLPTYLALGVLAVVFGTWLSGRETLQQRWRFLPPDLAAWMAPIIMAVLLVGITFLLYAPFAYWYGQGYNELNLWQGSRTPLTDYFVHWGVFLFLIITWMISETLDWMATTPVSVLRKLAPFRGLIWGSLVALLLGTVLLAVRLPGEGIFVFGHGIQVAWVALPLAAGAGILLLRPGLEPEKRAVLFLIGTGLVLTLLVEMVVLVGDIARMNTVFKFYYEVWVLFGISAAASFGWLLSRIPSWNPTFKQIWRIALAGLVLSAALYPLLATTAKIKDRMAPEAPRTLDGETYMAYAHYFDQGLDFDLGQDYAAIQWMRENIQGSPVIMEGNTVEYRWGSRFSIYTGLPAVVGWNWHQRQQRGGVVSADWVTDRIGEVNLFYTTPNAEDAVRLLEKYDVKFFVVGQLEQAYYPGPGLEKFSEFAGQLWEVVFQVGDTTVYRVIPNAGAVTSN
ncbi:MAG: DUF2298 domain-containing protein [Anaerolineales bacterium]